METVMQIWCDAMGKVDKPSVLSVYAYLALDTDKPLNYGELEQVVIEGLIQKGYLNRLSEKYVHYNITTHCCICCYLSDSKFSLSVQWALFLNHDYQLLGYSKHSSQPTFISKCYYLQQTTRLLDTKYPERVDDSRHSEQQYQAQCNG